MGNSDAQEEMIQTAKHTQTHDFIMEMPDGYDPRVEQGGSNFWWTETTSYNCTCSTT